MFPETYIKVEETKISTKSEILEEDILKNENSKEVLIMNYEDDFEEKIAKLVQSVKKEKEKDATNIRIKSESCQEQVINTNNADLEIQEQELCDDKTRITILKNFEKKRNKNIDPDIEWIEQQTFCCYHCEYSTHIKRHLIRHIRRNHNRGQEKKTFNCEYCMFTSKYNTSIGHHVARFHANELTKKCGTAESTKVKSCYDIPTKVRIEDHTTKNEHGVFKCNFCSYAIPNEKMMIHHLPVHLFYKREVVQCKQCPLKFTVSQLEKHVEKVHNPESLYKCPRCNYVTKYKTNRRRHIKINAKRDKCYNMVRKGNTERT